MSELPEVTPPEEIVLYPGDALQVGGVFVLGPGNSCDYTFRSEWAGHYPPLDEVLSAATGWQLR